MAKIIEVNGGLEVKKADVVVRARYKLNPLSLKFVTCLIAGLKRGDNINEEYIFKVKDFKELTGLKRKDLYWAVKESLKELLEKPLHIPTDDGFLMCNWVSGGNYIESQGEVRFMIYPKLRPYLLEAQKKFLKYKLENILSLKSSYVIRMYEILKDWFEMYSRYGHKAKVPPKSLNEFRQILEIPKSYRFNDIKRFILEKAKVELEKHTDIIFEYEEIKTGRKVTHLKFTIILNPAKLEANIKTEQESYFKSRKNFVGLLRKNYSGNGKFWGVKTINDSTYWLGLDNNGLAYASGKEIKDFNGIESAKLYDLWLKIAQNSLLYKELVSEGICLKDLFKNNKDLWLNLREEIITLREQGII